MPATSHLRPPWIPTPIGWAIAIIGLFLIGISLALHAAPSSSIGDAMTITRNGTRYVTTVKTVKRVVRGRVVHTPGEKVYVRVPILLVHTDHHVIRVPAHNVPLRSAAATVAEHVPVTVYIAVPTTVFLPTTVTTTITETEPASTITITLPLETIG